jgi:hypothetical protein
MSMKKLMILAAMLAMVAAAAFPALAQNEERDSGNSGGQVEANTTPSSGASEDGNLSYSTDPAPADGSSETSVVAPSNASTSGSSSELPASAPSGDSDSGGCFNADDVSLHSVPADNRGGDSAALTAASAPGCSFVLVEE